MTVLGRLRTTAAEYKQPFSKAQGLLGPSILSLNRKPLNFHNLTEHVEQLLQVDSEDESQGMGPQEWG